MGWDGVGWCGEGRVNRKVSLVEWRGVGQGRGS